MVWRLLSYPGTPIDGNVSSGALQRRPTPWMIA
jgi:hypothetical protein